MTRFDLTAWLSDALGEWRYLRAQHPPRGHLGAPLSAGLVSRYARGLVARARWRAKGITLGHGIIVHGTELAPGLPPRFMTTGPKLQNEGGSLEIGEGTLFVHQDMVPVTIRLGPSACVRIGRRVGMNYGVSITARGTIEIGDDVMIGPYAELNDSAAEPGVVGPSIRIEAGAWLGARARILAGAHIEPRAVIGAGVTVRGSVPARCLVLGDPPQITLPRARRDEDRDIGEDARRT